MGDLNRQRIFNILLLLLGIWVILLVKPYLSMLFLAFVVTVLFDPVYQRIVHRTGKPSLASAVSTFAVMLSIIIPTIIVVSIAANQAVTFANSIQKSVASGGLNTEKIVELVTKIAERYPDKINTEEVMQRINMEDLVTTVASKTANFFSGSVLSLLQNSLLMITNLIIFIMVLGYLFPVRDAWLKRMVTLSPLDDRQDRLFLSRLESMIKSIIKGTFLIAVVQGFLGGVIFWIVGIPASVFWGFMMTVASLIPLGSGIIYVPAGLILIASGAAGKGLLVLAWGTFIISTVDNVIRAHILSAEESHLPPLLTLLSVLGGVRMFGFIGFLYGPLIMMLFLTALRIYEERSFSGKKDSTKSDTSLSTTL